MPDSERRLILPVPNLGVTRVWEVGRVRFHPAGAVAGRGQSCLWLGSWRVAWQGSEDET